MPNALLSRYFQVRGLFGDLDFSAMKETQPDEVFVLRARGVPHLRGTGRGNLHVHLDVQVPTKLDDEQVELLKKLAALRGEERPGLAAKSGGGLFGKLRDAFDPGR